MTTVENVEVVAKRSLTCMYDGQSVEATAYVGLPFEEHGGWACEYGVIFAGAPRKHIHNIMGEDSMQALQLAIAMLGSILPDLEGTSLWRWNDEHYTGLPTSVDGSLFGNMP